VLFLNSGKAHTPINTTQTFADELQTSTDTASRIIQIQAKAKAASVTNSRL
jgi:transcription initiation factor TFIIIB Brf1 subunit/transcription initiation factor TFIIB